MEKKYFFNFNFKVFPVISGGSVNNEKVALKPIEKDSVGLI